MCGCQWCFDQPTVTRNYLYATSMDIRARTSSSSGFGTMWGVHPNTTSHVFHSPFWDQVSGWINYLNSVSFNTSTRVIDFIGTGGAGGCKATEYHSRARAFDLTSVQYTNGAKFDMRGSWEVADTGNRRGYCGVMASCRVNWGPGGVLSAGWVENGDTSHSNHIHIDNLHSFAPLSTASGGDRVILRRINAVFGGSTIPVASSPLWTQNDTNALTATLAAFGFGPCYNLTSITTDPWRTIGFLDVVAKHGIGNRSPGFFAPPGC
jgi:hypothetical protein